MQARPDVVAAVRAKFGALLTDRMGGIVPPRHYAPADA